MAGHSKWANIQHRKSAQDKKRGKIFSKLIREITIAARLGGGDLTANSRLRLAVDKAYASNMTKDTVERAIKRGAGGVEGNDLIELSYEGYGVGGTAILVKCMTDNRNRTVADVRHIFTKYGGNLGTEGSVAYLFSRQGQISFTKDNDENKIMELAIDAGAEDVVVNEDQSIDIITMPDDFDKVKDAMQKAGLEPINATITMEAATKVILDKDNAEKMLRMVEMLEDLDDVQEVFSNADIPNEILEQIC